MAKKASLFQDHRAVELIMSPGSSTHKHIGRRMRNFDSAVGDREKRNAVLSGTYAKLTQDPAMKNHLLSSGNNLLDYASPLDPVWGIGFHADDPRANNPWQWGGILLPVRHFLPCAKQFATVRPGRRTRPLLVDSALSLRMEEQNNLGRAAPGPLDSGQRL